MSSCNDESISADNLQASSAAIILGGDNGTLMYSTDGGINWTSSTGISGNIDSVACKGSNAVAATDVGIFRSVDGGVTWTYI